MEQLLSMGFSEDLASQALAATAGDTTTADSAAATAADWILSRRQSAPQHPLSQSPATQRSLERFFPLSKSPKSPQTPKPLKSPPNQEPTKIPLADRMRPRTLAEILGQDHLLSPTALLPSALRSSLLPSLILWGPPGSGKTSLARAIAAALPSSHRFLPLSALSSSLADIRSAISAARRTPNLTTVLFVDEIHRFAKPQQESFLPAIEDGSVVLIGATTENPSFHLVTSLLSRARLLALRPLLPLHIQSLLLRAASDPLCGLPDSSLDQEAVQFISLHCDGDARVALNALEAAAALAAARQSHSVALSDAKEAMQCKHVSYDRDGEEHYNLISALHKSMRGSDPDASIYWLARMLEGGEQPLYIARRLVRFASEDVGLADPSALGHAVACYQACHFIGLPECDVCLAQCVVFLALAPKSVAVYRALGEARRVVRESGGGNEGVPLHLRNAPTKLMKEVGYGKGYVYPPDNPDASQAYLPPSLQGRKFLNWPPLGLLLCFESMECTPSWRFCGSICRQHK